MWTQRLFIEELGTLNDKNEYAWWHSKPWRPSKILEQGPGLLSYGIPPKSISNSRIHLTRLLYTPGNSNVKIIVCSDKWKNEMFASYVTLFFFCFAGERSCCVVLWMKRKEPINLGFWELPTYPFPDLTFCPKWEISVNVDLGEG